jgi:hypothetical protein
MHYWHPRGVPAGAGPESVVQRRSGEFSAVKDVAGYRSPSIVEFKSRRLFYKAFKPHQCTMSSLYAVLATFDQKYICGVVETRSCF